MKLLILSILENAQYMLVSFWSTGDFPVRQAIFAGEEAAVLWDGEPRLYVLWSSKYCATNPLFVCFPWEKFQHMLSFIFLITFTFCI